MAISSCRTTAPLPSARPWQVDPAQLAPVGQSGAMAFDALPAPAKLTLSRIHRQTQDNPILDLAHALADERMGFSFHITTIYAGTETHIHYRNHLEAVFCMRGRGEVQTLADGNIYPIEPGTVYILDRHDEHLLRASEELELACVFNPPLVGNETHDADGVYPLLAVGD